MFSLIAIFACVSQNVSWVKLFIYLGEKIVQSGEIEDKDDEEEQQQAAEPKPVPVQVVPDKPKKED